MAQRIKQLREQSPLRQPQVAERLGLGLRGYQKLEKRGTTKWERAEELGEIFNEDPHWIWTGERRGPTPDPFAGTDDLSLLRGELLEAVQGLRAELRATKTEVLAEVAKVRKAQEALQRSPGRGRRSGGAKGS